MDSNKLRNELHEFIDHADERMVQLLYGMMKADQQIPETHKAILNDRLHEYTLNPSEVLTLQELKEKYLSGK